MRRRGFTLIEMLAVLAVIAFLAGVMGIGFRGDSAHSIRSGERIAIGMLEAARLQASLKQSRSRFLVEASPTANRSNQLRIIFTETSASSSWKTSGSAVLLPDGVRFHPELSSAETMRIDLTHGAEAVEGDGPEWFFYEFDYTGSLLTGTSRFILSRPTLYGSEGGPDEVDWADTPAQGGFLILRSGAIRFPEEIRSLRKP